MIKDKIRKKGIFNNLGTMHFDLEYNFAQSSNHTKPDLGIRSTHHSKPLCVDFRKREISFGPSKNDLTSDFELTQAT